MVEEIREYDQLFTSTACNTVLGVVRQACLGPVFANEQDVSRSFFANKRPGIGLTRPVFTHGQIYTALFSVRRRNDAKERLRAREGTTTNITYHELFLPFL
jgi:hypothetical protein